MSLRVLPEWISITTSSLTTYALLTVITTGVILAFIRRRHYVNRVDKVPGMPGGMTILGNALLVMDFSTDEIFQLITGYITAYRNSGPVVRAWIGPFPLFFLSTAEAFETVLSSNKLIDKSREYDFLHPWLNTGLLTSTGSKWQSRRKLLTPTFHFKILEDFVHVFNEHSSTLVQQLNKAAQLKRELNIYPFITACTLDIICDTAMGCNINAQIETNSDYVTAIYAMSRIIMMRFSNPLLQPDVLFHLSSHGKEHKKSLKLLHDFTNKVIRERKLERKSTSTSSKKQDDDDNYVSKKRRMAFLDLLLDVADDGKVLSDEDIREEVDTFMFEGHDTTTAGINWSLLLIGSHPVIQEQINEELDRVFGDSDRPVSTADLSELKYLECCIKEALRLYPPVPVMARKLSEDTIIQGYDIPKDSTVLLVNYMLHRDTKQFPDPELYQPERFFPENSRGRHPYAYVPFSAGARNCIGQKFALMEEKVILSTILRNFHIESLDKRDNLVLLGELILRPRDGIHIRFNPKCKK